MADADAGGIPELLRLVDSARRARAGGVTELLGHVDSGRRARAGAVSELLGHVDSERRARAGGVPELLGHVDSERRARAGAVSELLGRVDSTRRERRELCERLLLELTPRLEAFRREEREQDLKLARRFNVFKYLQTDELGLSRIIADLLDPAAEHGQGPVFLNAMLDMLSDSGEKTGTPFGSLRATGGNPAKVVTERWIPCGGLIDITVDIPSDERPFCLAFENKPYAADGYRQLLKYLHDLDAQYGRRFLLVYVPPYDREPDPYSLPAEDREYWRDRGQFTVMPYSGDEASLEGWFGTCRELCEAERLRVYLEDAQSFCRQLFGGSTMTTDSETHFIRKLLSDDRGHMHAALAIHDAWPAVRADVCRRFLRHLHRKLEQRLRKEFLEVGDFLVRSHYRRSKTNWIRLWITRDSWARSVPPSAITDGRTAIMMVNSGKDPNGWNWGVRSPKPKGEMTEAEKKRADDLEAKLRDSGLSLAWGSSDWWPQWGSPRRYQHWHPIVPDLAEELDATDGPITSYYLNGLLRIARLAIPVINEVEAAGTAAAVDEPVLGQEPEPADDMESHNAGESPDLVDSDD